MIGKYSLPNLLCAYRDNKDLIHAYIRRDTIEGLDDDSTQIVGMSIAMFLTIFLVSLVLWVWALYVTVRYWKELPTWAQILAILGLVGFVFGPIMTLIVVYVGKQTGSSYSYSYEDW